MQRHIPEAHNLHKQMGFFLFYYLSTLSVSRPCSIADKVINEYGVVVE
jgi:hypothetical protein